VEDLGAGRAHARTEPGREHDDPQGTHGAGGYHRPGGFQAMIARLPAFRKLEGRWTIG
jgi:hypothetical protein